MKFCSALYLGLLGLCCGLADAASAVTEFTGQERVHYQINIDQPTQHTAQVQITFPATSSDDIAVHMPAWRTGRYQIQNLASGVRHLQARSGSGEAFRIDKLDKSTWRIFGTKNQAVQISYEIYGDDLGGRVRHIDDSHAYLDASGIFMYNAAQRELPVQVQLKVPANWQSRSGMAACGEHCFQAANYDVLIDSPIETGVHEFRAFVQDGRQYELALWGRGNANIGQIENDLKKIIGATTALFDSAPFTRFLFIVHQTDGASGATEHINSTVIQKPRWSFSPRKDYQNFLATTAHEFFHTWNVKAYRPQELVPYRYQEEVYSPLLWWTEGGTSYFDELIILRAGLKTRSEYLDGMAKSLDDYWHTPGRDIMSARESSFDEWIAEKGERAKNASVGIYVKGEMLSLSLDLALRANSQGKVGLIDVHKILMADHNVNQGGFTEAHILAALKKLSGEDYGLWWQRYVHGIEELPLREQLRSFGLQHQIEAGKDSELKQEFWSGISIREDSDKDHAVVVQMVERNSPAWQAGLIGGDVIVAADDMRMNPKEFTERLGQWPQADVRLSFFRRDELQALNMTMRAQTKGKAKLLPLFELGKKQELNKKQKLANTQWLGVPWPKD